MMDFITHGRRKRALKVGLVTIIELSEFHRLVDFIAPELNVESCFSI